MKREPVGNEREHDRWLKTALIQSPAPTSADCLDGETLAAFADGGLNAQATAAVELHASSCTRCMAVLAAIERSGPPRTATHMWTPARVMRWLIPLTAAVTAVAIWVAVPERPITSVVEDMKTTTEQRTVPVPGPAPVPDAGSASVAQPGTANRTLAPDAQNREPDERADLRRERFAPEAVREAAGARASAQETVPPRPPAAAPAESTLGAARNEPAAAPAMSADTFAETVAPTAQRKTLAAKVVVTSESTAPNELFRWRVINNASIERSVDGGRTWTEIPPLPRDSVKGLTIAGIRATSDLHATVRMSNGSEFYTADGGMAWIQLQEK